MENKFTAEQQQMYEEMRKAKLACEAETALLNYYGLDASMLNLHHAEFEKINGFTLNEAVNPKSEHYIIEQMVQMFIDNTEFGGVSVSACWEMIIEQLTCSEEMCKKEIFVADTTFENVSCSSTSENYLAVKAGITAQVKEIASKLPNGEYDVNIIYSRNGEYFDSDAGSVIVNDGITAFIPE